MSATAYDALAGELRRFAMLEGLRLWHDEVRLSGLLLDFEPAHRREIRAVISAVQHGVVRALADAGPELTRLVVDRRVSELEAETHMRRDVALLAISTIAYALNGGPLPSLRSSGADDVPRRDAAPGGLDPTLAEDGDSKWVGATSHVAALEAEARAGEASWVGLSSHVAAIEPDEQRQARRTPQRRSRFFAFKWVVGLLVLVAIGIAVTLYLTGPRTITDDWLRGRWAKDCAGPHQIEFDPASGTITLTTLGTERYSRDGDELRIYWEAAGEKQESHARIVYVGPDVMALIAGEETTRYNRCSRDLRPG